MERQSTLETGIFAHARTPLVLVAYARTARPSCRPVKLKLRFKNSGSTPLGVPWNGHRVFPHRLSGESPTFGTRAPGPLSLFQRHVGKWSRKEYHAFDIPFTERIPRFCRTVLALGIPCKARGAQEYDAPNGGSLDADSANNGARRHLRSIGRAFGVDADPARRRSAKAVTGRFQGCESMSSFLPAVAAQISFAGISEPCAAIGRHIETR